jgi:Zn-finger nucleic acid-binding protein
MPREQRKASIGSMLAAPGRRAWLSGAGMADTATLICPKCRGEMRTYERNGIMVDQCQECRGIFLDRGELEQLLDAEHAHELRSDSGDRDRPLDRGKDEHRHGRRRSSRASLLVDLLGGGD